MIFRVFSLLSRPSRQGVGSILLPATAFACVTALLAIVLVGFAIWIEGQFALGVWAIYRVARGWMRLADRQPMPE